MPMLFPLVESASNLNYFYFNNTLIKSKKVHHHHYHLYSKNLLSKSTYHKIASFSNKFNFSSSALNYVKVVSNDIMADLNLNCNTLQKPFIIFLCNMWQHYFAEFKVLYTHNCMEWKTPFKFLTIFANRSTNEFKAKSLRTTYDDDIKQEEYDIFLFRNVNYYKIHKIKKYFPITYNTSIYLFIYQMHFNKKLNTVFWELVFQ